MRYTGFLLAVSFTVCFETPVFAYCSEPNFSGSEPSIYASPPDAPSSYRKPSVPYCLSEYSYSQRHTCTDFEISNYFDEINAYIDDLNTYAEEAQQLAEDLKEYANEAIDYANSAVEFSNDVYDYVECEANDVKAQHE